jgi:ubiquinone/menaquinone biosynthesis C-methylase UbiE
MDQSSIEAAKARTARVFGELAADYDQGGPAFFTYFGRRLVELADIAPDSRVLDVATGRGAVLFPAAAKVGAGGSVIGIDLTEAMVQALTVDIERRAVTNADVRTMDAENLAFVGDSFDAVLCGFGVMFFPRLAVALSEFRRVLTTGGMLAVSTFKTLPPTPAIAPIMNAFQHTSQRPLTQELSTPDELRGALEHAGFHDVSIHLERFEAVHADEDAYWSWAMSLLPGVWYRAQPTDTQTRFKEDVYEHLSSIRQSDGIHESITANFALARK